MIPPIPAAAALLLLIGSWLWVLPEYLHHATAATINCPLSYERMGLSEVSSRQAGWRGAGRFGGPASWRMDWAGGWADMHAHSQASGLVGGQAGGRAGMLAGCRSGQAVRQVWMAGHACYYSQPASEQAGLGRQGSVRQPKVGCRQHSTLLSPLLLLLAPPPAAAGGGGAQAVPVWRHAAGGVPRLRAPGAVGQAVPVQHVALLQHQ